MFICATRVCPKFPVLGCVVSYKRHSEPLCDLSWWPAYIGPWSLLHQCIYSRSGGLLVLRHDWRVCSLCLELGGLCALLPCQGRRGPGRDDGSHSVEVACAHLHCLSFISRWSIYFHRLPCPLSIFVPFPPTVPSFHGTRVSRWSRSTPVSSHIDAYHTAAQISICLHAGPN